MWPRAAGAPVSAQPSDAVQADPAAICKLFDDVEADVGGIDVFIANAGLPFIGVPVVDVTEFIKDTPQSERERIAAGSPLGRNVDATGNRQKG